jgi:hypothetical protein
MAALSTRVTLTVRDRYSNEGRIIFHIAPGIVDPNNSTVQAIVAAVNATINPAGISIELSQVEAVTGSAVVGADYINTDKGLFPALDQDGQPHNYKVPGIKSSILQANSDQIDFTDSNVIAYVSAVTANAIGRGGAAITALNSGYRTANRKPIKG